MLSVPPRTLEPTAATLPDELHSVITTAYGTFAAEAHIADVTALKRSRDRAAKAKLASSPNEDGDVEEPLLLYGAVLAAAVEVLGSEVREQKGSLSLSQRGGWDEPKASPCKSHDLALDQAGVLLNLAASWSARGASPPLSDGEAIKLAAKHFQLAAGALQAAKALQLSSVLEPCPADLTDAALDACRALMLAQAQACFCEKAALDGMGAGTQAKLCMGAQQLYTQAAEGLASIATKCKPMHAWGHAVAAARAKQYESHARWHAASEAGAAERRGEQQSQLQLCVASANEASAALTAHKATGDDVKASLAAHVAKAAEALRSVTRDNELVYYAKLVPTASLPAIEPKVLAKPTTVMPLIESLGALPLPRTIRKPDETVLGGGADGFEEPVSALFSRLGTEFKAIPLSDRYANEKQEEDAMKRAKQVAKEAEKREAAERGTFGGLGALFSGRSTGRADEKKAKDEKKAEGGKGSSKDSGKDSKGGAKDKSSSKAGTSGTKGGSAAAADDDADDEKALQAALAASLREAASLSGGSSSSHVSPPNLARAASEKLTAMGFTRAAALDALRACKYDVTAAADRLLG